jgi:sodium transport system ATP-binding protein
MIEADGLVKHFLAADGTIVPAVDGISFAVAPGEMVGLLGANGVGKTTTMRMLATLLSPTAGTARIGGCDIVADPLGVRRQLGYLSATTGVPDRLTPREVWQSFGRLHGLDESIIERRVAELVVALDLAACSRRPCGRLSTGQRQRVSLGRALIHEPPALILDEPTSGLDIVAARHLLDLLERLRGEGRAILLSTHRLQEIELRCDRFLIIHAGRIVGGGTREEMVATAGSLEAAFFAAIEGEAPA